MISFLLRGVNYHKEEDLKMDITGFQKTAMGLDSFEDAIQVNRPEGESDHHEDISSDIYVVTPLRSQDEEGTLVQQATALWLHQRSRWKWNFFSYASDCWVWVTDARDGGNLVTVDRLEAHLSHDSCFGDHSVTRNNVSKAHASLRMYGFAVCKAGIYAYGCAEKTDFGRWCTEKKHH